MGGLTAYNSKDAPIKEADDIVVNDIVGMYEGVMVRTLHTTYSVNGEKFDLALSYNMPKEDWQIKMFKTAVIETIETMRAVGYI